MRLVNVEARSECAPQCDSRRFVDIAKLISPPRNHVATQRRGAHRSDPPPSRAFLRSTNPSLNPIAANRYPESGLCGSAAGLLEHRLQVRLRELQSIMVRVTPHIIQALPRRCTQSSRGAFAGVGPVSEARLTCDGSVTVRPERSQLSGSGPDIRGHLMRASDQFTRLSSGDTIRNYHGRHS